MTMIRMILEASRAALLIALIPGGVAAQVMTLNGRALDPAGEPLAGIQVLMHRVDGLGGATLDSATTDASGAFTLAAEAVDDTAAVYFAATRSEGQLFIGPFVREPFDDSVPYILVVGGEPVDLGAPLPTAMPPVSPAPGPRRWALLLLPLTGLLGTGAWLLSRVGKPPERRRLLIRLASLDEQIAAEGSDPLLDRERERIAERLLYD